MIKIKNFKKLKKKKKKKRTATELSSSWSSQGTDQIHQIRHFKIRLKHFANIPS